MSASGRSRWTSRAVIACRGAWVARCRARIALPGYSIGITISYYTISQQFAPPVRGAGGCRLARGTVRNEGESRHGAGRAERGGAMRLTLTTFVTIDGVMQSPGAPEEDPRDGFDLGGWLPPHFDEETGQYMNEVFDAADAFLLGRFSYQAMAAFWPHVSDPANHVATQFNSRPKHVVTATLTDLTWAGAVPLRGDIPQQVAELKRLPGRELQ